MYINPFVLGVIVGVVATLGVEVVAMFGYAFFEGGRRWNEEHEATKAADVQPKADFDGTQSKL